MAAAAPPAAPGAPAGAQQDEGLARLRLPLGGVGGAGDAAAAAVGSSPTAALRYGADSAHPVDLAVVWVNKAIKGSTQWVDCCHKDQLGLYRRRKRLKPLFLCAKYMYLALALVEQPSWCLGSSECRKQGDDLYTWRLPVLPFQLSNALEILLLLLFAYRWWLRRRSLGEGGRHDGWHTAGISLVSVALLDCTVAIVNIVGVVPTTFRLCRLCRPLVFICFTKFLRKTVERLVSASRHFLDILLSLAICVVFFVWLGIVAFTRTREGDTHFVSWSESAASLWILFTTANYPDVMIPSYNDNRFSFIFFFVYLVMSLYLLNNILLAAVYDAYKEQMKKLMTNLYDERLRSMDNAFDLLCEGSGGDQQSVSRERWMAFFSAYCGAALRRASPEACRFNAQQGEQAFDALDVDGSGGIDRAEFHLVVSVLADPQVYIPLRPIPEAASRGCGRHVVRFITSGIPIPGTSKCVDWKNMVDSVILIEVLLAIGQTVIFVSPLGGGRFQDDALVPRGIWFRLLAITTIFFAVEMSLRVSVLGAERFWHRNPMRNRFDVVTVVALVAAELACCLVPGPPDIMLRFVVLLHAARAIRLAAHVRPFRFLATLVARLVPVYHQLGLLLFLVYYIFATFGEQIFGGEIRRGDPRLEGSGFADGEYWSLNFNDFPSSLVTLFVIMVVNNWFVVADGFMRVTSDWASIFFVAFFVITNLIVLNILMALILDSSAAVREELTQGMDESALGRGLSEHSRREFVLQRLLFSEDERREALPPAGTASPAASVARRRRTLIRGEDSMSPTP